MAKLNSSILNIYSKIINCHNNERISIYTFIYVGALLLQSPDYDPRLASSILVASTP